MISCLILRSTIIYINAMMHILCIIPCCASQRAGINILLGCLMMNRIKTMNRLCSDTHLHLEVLQFNTVRSVKHTLGLGPTSHFFLNYISLFYTFQSSRKVKPMKTNADMEKHIGTKNAQIIVKAHTKDYNYKDNNNCISVHTNRYC